MSEERTDNPIKEIELLEDADDKWYANFIGGNGEIVFTAEGHSNRADMRDIAERSFPGVPITVVTNGDGNDKS